MTEKLDPDGHEGAQSKRSPEVRHLGPLYVPLVVCGLAIVIVGALAVARIRQGGPTDKLGNASGAEAPKVNVRDLDAGALLRWRLDRPSGETTTLADLTGGKPLLVNLWAQSCVPCVTEMPLLERAHRAIPEVTFVGVDVLDEPGQAAAMAKQTGITYEWVRDSDGGWAAAAKTTNIPMTVCFNAKGTATAAKVGAFHSQREIEKWIDSCLGTKP